jgi:hypothetical protein
MKGRTKTEGVLQKGAEENIWDKEVKCQEV